MTERKGQIKIGTAAILTFFAAGNLMLGDFERLPYRNPGLIIDLGVGLWANPMPVDFDGDGDLDLLVSTNDVPSNGVYFFENVEGKVKFPVFKPGIRIGPGIRRVDISYVNGKPRALGPAKEYVDFPHHHFNRPVPLPLETDIYGKGEIRANQWKFCDYDGDGSADLIVGVGVWEEYGWDNAYNKEGVWTSGPLHGFVYLLRNSGSDESPSYDKPIMVNADGKPVDVYGMPSPNFADFDGDGDLDLMCGSFVDRFAYFENIGTRCEPRYAAGRELTRNNKPMRMDLCMIVPVAIDWDEDGDVDLVVGEEDGRVSLLEHTGQVVDGMPQFLPPKFFQQEADAVKFGALATPFSIDWDDDGDEDIISGNTAGYIGFIENLDGAYPPKWAAPRYLKAGGKTIRIMAGSNGSIQGPAEAKWGYTVLSAADWDADGLTDLVVNSIWGKVIWFRNRGTRGNPRLDPARPIKVEWNGSPPKPEWNWWNPSDNELTTQWRTTPLVIDWNGDELNDLIMLDAEGCLAFFERRQTSEGLTLTAPRRIFRGRNGSVFGSDHRMIEAGEGLLVLNSGFAGKSGRRKFVMTDWDQDGKIDLLVNSRNLNFLRNVSTEKDRVVFRDEGPLGDAKLAGHTTSPALVDWDKDGIKDLLVGAEDGFFYYLKNPHSN